MCGPFPQSSSHMPDHHRPRGTTLSPPSAERVPSSSPAGPVAVFDGMTQRQRRSARLLLIDCLMLGLAVTIGLIGASRTGSPTEHWAWTLSYCLSALAVMKARGGYAVRLEASALDALGHAFVATALAATLIITARVLFDPDPHAAAQTVRLWGFAAAYLFAGRLAFNIAVHQAGRAGLKTLIVGAGSVGHMIARRLQDRPEMGLRPVGFLDKEPREGDDDLPPVLGASWDLEEVVREHQVEQVLVTFSTAPHEVLLSMVRRCRAMGVEVALVPRLFEEVSHRVAVDHLGGIALLRVGQIDPKGWQFEVKYALDRVVGALMVLAMAPVLLAIALMVKLSSTGPVFFHQKRVGIDGHEFEMLKFRTMRLAPPGTENDAAWAARALGSEEKGAVAEVSADRRTRFGRFLRRWSLDELPQILNVVNGDMSLVGPRPERVGYVRAFEQHVYRYGDRHRVKSGLTGWAQVNGLRGETSLQDRIEWDNYYVENWSPLLDLKILALTLPAVFGGRGAE
jgi:exopolysaccharide biosynthesis polyprenyl glycosylphosphotransferase